MSGHSKWATIKRAKAVTDKKKGVAFTKLSKLITIAARSGGDPTANFKLRMIMDKAREANMPSDTVDRAIKRGTGELEGAVIEGISYEGFGPGGVAVVVETLTDNKNRTVANVKHIFTKHGGNLGSTNSVMWMFDRKGVIVLNAADFDTGKKEELELKLIEGGAQDIKEADSFLTIYTAPEDLHKVKGVLDAMGLKTDSAELEYVGKESVAMDEANKEKLLGLFEELDADDDVQNFHSNGNL